MALSQGARADAQNERGSSALSLAVSLRDWDSVDLLLSAGAPASSVSAQGFCGAQMMAAELDPEGLRQALARGLDRPDAKAQWGDRFEMLHSRMSSLARHHAKRPVWTLVDSALDLSSREYPLRQADRASAILCQKNMALHWRELGRFDREPRLPLLMLREMVDAEVAHFLLDHGFFSKSGEARSRCFWTPVSADQDPLAVCFCKAPFNDEQTLSLLIKLESFGFDLRARSDQGRSIGYWCALRGFWGCLDWLSDRDISPHDQDSEGFCALMNLASMDLGEAALASIERLGDDSFAREHRDRLGAFHRLLLDPAVKGLRTSAGLSALGVAASKDRAWSVLALLEAGFPLEPFEGRLTDVEAARDASIRDLLLSRISAQERQALERQEGFSSAPLKAKPRL